MQLSWNNAPHLEKIAHGLRSFGIMHRVSCPLIFFPTAIINMVKNQFNGQCCYLDPEPSLEDLFSSFVLESMASMQWPYIPQLIELLE